MTRPIRNTGPCFPSGLPRQRGQRDVLSHTEFYKPIFCMLSVFQAIPFELPRKPPTVNRWDSTLCTPGWGQVLQSISSPNVKCAPETTARWPTKSNPWYNDDCEEAIKQRKQALSKFKKISKFQQLE